MFEGGLPICTCDNTDMNSGNEGGESTTKSLLQWQQNHLQEEAKKLSSITKPTASPPTKRELFHVLPAVSPCRAPNKSNSQCGSPMPLRSIEVLLVAFGKMFEAPTANSCSPPPVTYPHQTIIPFAVL